MNAKQLRSQQPTANSRKQKAVVGKRNAIYIVLDNVLDTYNVGSIFRLADAVAAKKVYLCGNMEIPPNPRIKKASINTTEIVNWSYVETAAEAIARVRESESKQSLPSNEGQRVRVVAIEQSNKSVPYNKFNYKLPICLVVGNETHGVSKEVLDMADAIVEIPMFGVNISLNVMVSLAIVSYRVLEN